MNESQIDPIKRSFTDSVLEKYVSILILVKVLYMRFLSKTTNLYPKNAIKCLCNMLYSRFPLTIFGLYSKNAIKCLCNLLYSRFPLTIFGLYSKNAIKCLCKMVNRRFFLTTTINQSKKAIKYLGKMLYSRFLSKITDNQSKNTCRYLVKVLNRRFFLTTTINQSNNAIKYLGKMLYEIFHLKIQLLFKSYSHKHAKISYKSNLKVFLYVAAALARSLQENQNNNTQTLCTGGPEIYEVIEAQGGDNNYKQNSPGSSYNEYVQGQNIPNVTGQRTVFTPGNNEYISGSSDPNNNQQRAVFSAPNVEYGRVSGFQNGGGQTNSYTPAVCVEENSGNPDEPNSSTQRAVYTQQNRYANDTQPGTNVYSITERPRESYKTIIVGDQEMHRKPSRRKSHRRSFRDGDSDPSVCSGAKPSKRSKREKSKGRSSSYNDSDSDNESVTFIIPSSRNQVEKHQQEFYVQAPGEQGEGISCVESVGLQPSENVFMKSGDDASNVIRIPSENVSIRYVDSAQNNGNYSLKYVESPTAQNVIRMQQPEETHVKYVESPAAQNVISLQRPEEHPVKFIDPQQSQTQHISLVNEQPDNSYTSSPSEISLKGSPFAASPPPNQNQQVCVGEASPEQAVNTNNPVVFENKPPSTSNGMLVNNNHTPSTSIKPVSTNNLSYNIYQPTENHSLSAVACIPDPMTKQLRPIFDLLTKNYNRMVITTKDGLCSNTPKIVGFVKKEIDIVTQTIKDLLIEHKNYGMPLLDAMFKHSKTLLRKICGGDDDAIVDWILRGLYKYATLMTGFLAIKNAPTKVCCSEKVGANQTILHSRSSINVGADSLLSLGIPQCETDKCNLNINGGQINPNMMFKNGFNPYNSGLFNSNNNFGGYSPYCAPKTQNTCEEPSNAATNPVVLMSNSSKSEHRDEKNDKPREKSSKGEETEDEKPKKKKRSAKSSKHKNKNSSKKDAPYNLCSVPNPSLYNSVECEDKNKAQTTPVINAMQQAINTMQTQCPATFRNGNISSEQAKGLERLIEGVLRGALTYLDPCNDTKDKNISGMAGEIEKNLGQKQSNNQEEDSEEDDSGKRRNEEDSEENDSGKRRKNENEKDDSDNRKKKENDENDSGKRRKKKASEENDSGKRRKKKDSEENDSGKRRTEKDEEDDSSLKKSPEKSEDKNGKLKKKTTGNQDKKNLNLVCEDLESHSSESEESSTDTTSSEESNTKKDLKCKEINGKDI